MPREDITHIENRAAFLELLKQNPGVFVIKFGADWCGPCKMIENDLHKYYEQLPDNVMKAIIDVDVSFDLYAYLKSKRIVTGIPAVLCYYKGNTTYVPDNIHIGIDKLLLNNFFEKCILFAKSHSV